MGFDDLSRDRQAEPGVLAKALLGPVGVETLEHPLEGALRNAGAVVVDDDFKAVALAAGKPRPVSGRSSTRTTPPGFEKERALTMRLSNTWARRESWPSTRQPPRAAALSACC